MCLNLKTCKRKTYIEVLSGFTIILCSTGYWEFEAFEKYMIAVLRVLPPWSGMPYKDVRQSRDPVYGPFNFQWGFCLFWEPRAY